MTTTEVYCTCNGKGDVGFTNLGVGTDQEWWVCAGCGKPTRATWERYQTEDQMLNLFRGGPIDGYAYETTVLLSHDALAIPELDRYKWTPEIVVSQRTGARARVWVYQSGDEPEAAPAVPAIGPTNNQYAVRRKALKLSRGEFAEISGVNTSQLSRLETGNGEVKAGVTERVEEILAKLEAERNPS